MNNRHQLMALLADSPGCGLLFIDIHDFHNLNKLQGISCGDSILEQCYQRLAELIQDRNRVFRVGDDEFCLLFPQPPRPALMALTASKLADRLQAEYSWNKQALNIKVNIGIALWEISGDSETLLLDAESAAKQAKQLHESFYLYEHSQNTRNQQQRELLADFRKALTDSDFELYYQPKVALQEQRGHYCEALIRWQHPQHGFIPPDEFLPLCDALGLNLQLSKWVINTALRQLSQWPNNEHCHVAINLSADLVDEPELEHIVNSALRIWGVDPEQLTIEITENAIIEDKQSGFDNLSRLRALGCKVSIDDFGTGYSSLEYFKNIPANELKIDRSFIQHINSNRADQKIVKLIIELAHAFELSVVAEGIEDEASLNIINVLGCDFAQGYYFSRPLCNTDYIDWLQS